MRGLKWCFPYAPWYIDQNWVILGAMWVHIPAPWSGFGHFPTTQHGNFEGPPSRASPHRPSRRKGRAGMSAVGVTAAHGICLLGDVWHICSNAKSTRNGEPNFRLSRQGFKNIEDMFKYCSYTCFYLFAAWTQQIQAMVRRPVAGWFLWFSWEIVMDTTLGGHT